MEDEIETRVLFNKVPFLLVSYSSGRSHSFPHCDFRALVRYGGKIGVERGILG